MNFAELGETDSNISFLKKKIIRMDDGILVTPGIPVSLVQLHAREEHCVQEFWANLEDSSPEVFAAETVVELLAGKMVVQALPDEGQPVWRAALGPENGIGI